MVWWWFRCKVMYNSCNCMDCKPPGSFVHGISQVRILEWVAFSFSRGSNLGLLHCMWISYWLSHQGSPSIWFILAKKKKKWLKLVLEKAEEPEIKLPTSAGSQKKQESSRKISISALLTMPKPLTVWITINCGKFWKRWEYQTIWPVS